MSDRRLLDYHFDSREALTDLAYPVILPKQPQGLRNRFIESSSRDLDRVFNSVEVFAGHEAGSDAHSDVSISSSSFIRPIPLGPSLGYGCPASPRPSIEIRPSAAEAVVATEVLASIVRGVKARM